MKCLTEKCMFQTFLIKKEKALAVVFRNHRKNNVITIASHTLEFNDYVTLKRSYFGNPTVTIVLFPFFQIIKDNTFTE